MKRMCQLALRATILTVLGFGALGCFGGGAVLQPAEVAPIEPITVDEAGATERLAAAVRFKTVSYQDKEKFDAAEFKKFRDFLEASFPKVHATLNRELVNGHSLLYTWKGSDESLKPALLMAHQDVVPAKDSAEKSWTHDPFSGDVDEEHIWGRGTLDDKANVLATLEAVEQLLSAGYQPTRTVLLAYGHDEEVGGPDGAKKVAELLASRGVELEFVMDEGMAVIEPGIISGVDQWAAMIGIAEKGYVTFELTAHHEGGHSSQPTPDSAIGMLADAITRLENNQMPSRLSGPSRETLRYVQPHMKQPAKFLAGNMWLFGGLIKWSYGGTAQGNALTRTTTAVTMINAGYKENVLPTEASVIVNHRILPGDTSKDVKDHVRKTIKNDAIEIRTVRTANEPSPVSQLDTEGMQTIVKTIREIYPGIVIAPALVLGGTDSKHFTDLTDSVFRFAPMRFTKDDLHRFHGIDERVRIAYYHDSIRFYVRLIENIK